MKRLFSLFALLAIISNMMAQEIPSGFNYQAVIRDASGNIISDEEITVELSIQDIESSNIWIETHTITTNQYGMISLVVGQGTRTGGAATDFGDIDWSSSAMKLKTVITYNATDVDMGSSDIWAVPYSLVAADLAGNIGKLSVVEEADGTGIEPLFEVKNNTGQTVFAVYNEGVEIFFDDSDPKGIKGSFAVRGFGTTKEGEPDYLFVNRDSARIYLNNDDTEKGIKGSFAVGSFNSTGAKTLGNEYLRITEDSARIYINDTEPALKGIKGSFAVQGFKNIDKGDGNNYFDISMDQTSAIVSPSRNRILWYPYSNAFLAGRVLVEDPANVGENSFVSGFESRAKGDYSQAMGYRAYADGLNSTSIGQNSLAGGDNSYAIGQGAEVLSTSGYAIGMGASVDTDGAYSYALGHNAKALAESSYAIGDSAQAYGIESYAIGRRSIASGDGSFAFGSAGLDTLGNPTTFVQAKGNHSVAIGQGAIAMEEGSIAIGVGDSAINHFSMALGYKTTSSGQASLAIGSGTTASGYGSTAMGFRTKASGNNSTAMGGITTASGNNSTAMGVLSIASGNISTAMGGATASGNYSAAMGFYATASGENSTAIGYSVNAPSYGEVALGFFNTDYTPIETRRYNPADRLLVIGNGEWNNRKDALVILKDGTSFFNGILNPAENGSYTLGSSSYRWYEIYAINGTINISDARYKTNIENIENPVDKIMLINGVRYNWKTEEYHEMNFDDKTHLGVLAQEVEEVLPELVYTDEKGYKSVSYEKLTPVLIEALKEQQEEITELKARLAAIEAMLDI